MKLPFTEADYDRAIRRCWLDLSERERETLIKLSAFSKIERRPFTMTDVAEYCKEHPSVFLSIVGQIGSRFADHMGASTMPPDEEDAAPIWWAILFQRVGESRTLIKLRTPFVKTLQNPDSLPLQFVTKQGSEQ